MLQDMLCVHLRTCGRMYTRNVSEKHRPRIMILLGEWSMRKRAMAAPDQMDQLPISIEWNPDIVSPP
jgi:hypothetical protein